MWSTYHLRKTYARYSSGVLVYNPPLGDCAMDSGPTLSVPIYSDSTCFKRHVQSQMTQCWQKGDHISLKVYQTLNIYNIYAYVTTIYIYISRNMLKTILINIYIYKSFGHNAYDIIFGHSIHPHCCPDCHYVSRTSCRQAAEDQSFHH